MQCTNTGEVTEREHHDFLLRMLNYPPRRGLFIAEVGRDPVGQGRIDFEHAGLSICQVGYSIAKAYRGRGYGQQLVEILVQQIAKAEMHYETVQARIRRGNLQSVVCAMRAGVNSIEFF
jgi:RimJ/RimL family protein N-acetyltransferase